jgi:hypothetical protein
VVSYSLVDGGGGVAHREVEVGWKETLAGHEVRRASAMVLSLSMRARVGKRGKRRRGGSLSEEACKRRCPKEGVLYGDEDGNREPTRMPKRRGSLCKRTRRVQHNTRPRESGHKWALPLTVFAGHTAIVTRRA